MQKLTKAERRRRAQEALRRSWEVRKELRKTRKKELVDAFELGYMTAMRVLGDNHDAAKQEFYWQKFNPFDFDE